MRIRLKVFAKKREKMEKTTFNNRKSMKLASDIDYCCAFFKITQTNLGIKMPIKLGRFEIEHI